MHNRKGSSQSPGADGSAGNHYGEKRRVAQSNGGVAVPAPKSASSASVPQPRSASALEIAAALEEDRRTESGLTFLIREEKLKRKNVPLTELHTIEVAVNGGTTELVALGIDGQLIIDRITEATKESEPLAPITVTTPLAVYSEFEKLEMEMNGLEQMFADPEHYRAGKPVAFKPVFVFDGASLNPKLNLQAGNSTFPPLPERILALDGVDIHARAANVSSALREEVAKRVGAWDEDVLMFIITCLRRTHPDVFIAPYVGWGQLAAFLAPTATVISDVWGSLELLAFPCVERVITRLDVEHGVMDVVVKQDVINAINRRLPKGLKKYNEFSFAEWVMLDTIRHPYRLPFLSQPFENVLERFSYGDSGDAFAKQQSKPEYRARVQANLAVLDTPVMSVATGECAPLYRVCGSKRHTCLTPSESYGDVLPLALYYFLHVGHMLPSLWSSMGQHMLVDRVSPLDSPELRDAITRILTLRVHSANQISQCVQNSLAPTEWYREYGNDSSPLAKLTRLKTARELILDDWPLQDKPEINASGADQVYFYDVLPYATRSLPASEDPKGLYRTVRETSAAALLQTLDLLGYYEHSSINADPTLNMETDLSRALACFATDTLSEYGLLFIELLRTGALHDNPIHMTQFPKVTVDSIRFACRTVSIIPLNIEKPWSGPVDVEMAAFGAISRRYQLSIKTLVQAVTTGIMFSGRSSVPLEDINAVTELLPFRYPLEFGAGVVMQYILTNNIGSYDAVARAFPEMSSVESDLSTLFHFWNYAYKAMIELRREEQTVVINPLIMESANTFMCEAAARFNLQPSAVSGSG